MTTISRSIPLHLRYFDVLTPDVSESDVINDLRSMMDLEMKNEESFFQSDKYNKIVDLLLSGGDTLKGNANQWGRSRGVVMPHPPEYQSYNANEMFRSSVINKTYGYIQNVALFDVFSRFTEIPKDLRKVKDMYRELYPHLKVPTHEQFRSVDHVLRNKGRLRAEKPGASGAISLWSADGHYCKLETFLDDGYFILSVKLQCVKKMVDLKFTLPKNERFSLLDGKISKPNISLNNNDEVVFCFSIVTEVEQRDLVNFMTVDLNMTSQFTATVFFPGTMEHSAPYHPNRKIRSLDEKIKSRYELADELLEKSDICEKSKRYDKASKLRLERRRILDKASRLKDERSVQVAVQLHEIALENNAYIVFEDLRWVGNLGGKWDRNEVQEKTKHLAQSSGIKTKKVSSRNTSRDCPNCGKKVVHRKRMNYCHDCKSSLDRDVSSTRVMGVRNLRIKSFLQLKQQKSAHTQVSYSVSATSVTRPEPDNQVTLFQGVKDATTPDSSVLLL